MMDISTAQAVNVLIVGGFGALGVFLVRILGKIQDGHKDFLGLISELSMRPSDGNGRHETTHDLLREQRRIMAESHAEQIRLLTAIHSEQIKRTELLEDRTHTIEGLSRVISQLSDALSKRSFLAHDQDS